jgi:hypothetical protein
MKGALAKEQAYLDNTGRDLWEDIYDFIRDKYKDDIFESNIDCDENGGTPKNYVWIHIKKDGERKTIKRIIASLEEYFMSHMNQYMIPKLLSTICKNLCSSELYFANALCEYQAKFRKERTKEFIHVYFEHIRRSQCHHAPQY